MTVRKISILDDEKLRKKIDELYENQSQMSIVKWAFEIAKHSIYISNISEKDFPESTEE